MVGDKILYACIEHIEVALDDYVNQEESAPNMVEISSETQIACSYCDEKAKYKLLP